MAQPYTFHSKKKRRKPVPQPPKYYWWQNDNCWWCQNKSNCGNCRILKEVVTEQKKKQWRKTKKIDF